MPASFEDLHFITAHIPSGAVGPGDALRARILDAGLRILRDHPDGYMVAPSSSLDSLEARGFRARPLRDRHLLRLAAVTLDLSQGLPDHSPDLTIQSADEPAWTHWILQLEGPLTASWLDAIRAAGATQLLPIPPYGLWALMPAASAAVVARMDFVAWCGPMQPAYRLHPSLDGATGTRPVRIEVLPVAAVDEVLGLLLEVRGAEVAHAIVGPGEIEATLDVARLPQLLRHPAVYMIEAAGPDLPLDERSAAIVGGRLDAALPPDTQPVAGYGDVLTALSLDGAGVLIGFVDSGIDTNDDPTLHAALRGRGLFFEDLTSGTFPTDRIGHGTHVAGAAVGHPSTADLDADGFLYGLGVAPGASFGSLNPINRGNPNAADDLDRARRLGARSVSVANNSWSQHEEDGSSLFDQGYTSRSKTYDRAVRDALDDDTGVPLAIVAALGNSNPTGELDRGTVEVPWETKNVITVGATVAGRLGDLDFSSDLRSLALKSSVGPAKDGRLLPTVVAPGMYITSTHSMSASTVGIEVFPGRYIAVAGTSLAAPHVSGLCALYVQWWRDRTGGGDPSPAMLKALLISGAVDCVGGEVGPPATSLIGHVPDPQQGWGRANLPTVLLQSPGSDRGPRLFVDQRVAFEASNQSFTMRVSVVDAGRPLRVTLVYTDAPGSSSAARALVNKLSLELALDDGSVTWHGNHFVDGWTPSGAYVDDVNNVECVYLQAAEGTYVVRVVATSVTHNARRPSDASPWQDFALVVENAQPVTTEPVQVVLTLDTSGSMVSAGYDQPTLRVAQQLIDLLRPGDRIGLVDFNSDATVRYPAVDTPTLVPVDGQGVLDEAKARVMDLAFGGCTYMGRAIELAQGLFESGDHERAVVFVSDGEDNKGCRRSDATRAWGVDAVEALPGDVRVYTCALGPLSDGARLAEMAGLSGGRFFSSPTLDDLGVVFGFLRGAITHDGVIANESSFASTSRVGAFVEAAATRACFTCAWDDPSLRFTPAAPSSPEDIAVRLRHPSGRLVHPDASFVRRVVERGYVVFDVADPAPGRWYIEVATARRSHSRYTAAGFVSSPLVVDVRTPHSRLIGGAPLDVLVSARLEGARIDELRARATVTSPSTGVGSLRRRHARELDALRASLPAGDAEPSTRALIELDRRYGGELLRRRSAVVTLRPHPDGLRARVVTGAPGSCCARVLVRGRAGGQAFERLALVCAAVD